MPANPHQCRPSRLCLSHRQIYISTQEKTLTLETLLWAKALVGKSCHDFPQAIEASRSPRLWTRSKTLCLRLITRPLPLFSHHSEWRIPSQSDRTFLEDRPACYVLRSILPIVYQDGDHCAFSFFRPRVAPISHWSREPML